MGLKIKAEPMEIRKIDYRTLKPLQGDLKIMTETNYARLKKSFSEKNMFVPMMVWKKGSEFFILDGHGREKFFEKEGAVFVDAKGKETYEVPCLIIDAKDEKDAKEKLLIISSQYQTVSQEGFDAFTFDLDDDWLKDTVSFDAFDFPEPQEEEEAKDEDEVPEVAEGKPVAIRGDVWTLGDHKVICGDSTDEKDWAKLIGGNKASLVFTDPPYGVSYADQGGKFAKIKNDGLTGDALEKFLKKVFTHLTKHTHPKAAFYIWHASTTLSEFHSAILAAGLEMKQYIIWAKNSFVFGRADYHWAHEPCFYACKAGQSPEFHADRTQQTVWRVSQGSKKDGLQTTIGPGLVLTDGSGSELFIKEKAPKGKKARRIRLRGSVILTPDNPVGTVWEVDKDTGTDHPTQKPVELGRRALENSSRPGEIVLDPFLGSGSTLMAAELTGRRCFGFELEPRYVDVVIKRWEKITGKRAKREKK